MMKIQLRILLDQDLLLQKVKQDKYNESHAIGEIAFLFVIGINLMLQVTALIIGMKRISRIHLFNKPFWKCKII